MSMCVSLCCYTHIYSHMYRKYIAICSYMCSHFIHVCMYTVYVCLPHPSCIYSNVDLSSHAFVYLALHAQVYRHDIAVVSNTVTLSITTTKGVLCLLCLLFVSLYSSYVCLLFALSVVCFVCCIRKNTKQKWNKYETNTKQMLQQEEIQ